MPGAGQDKAVAAKMAAPHPPSLYGREVFAFCFCKAFMSGQLFEQSKSWLLVRDESEHVTCSFS